MIICFSCLVYANSIESNQTVKVLCFEFEDQNEKSFCKPSKHKVVLLSPDKNITNIIAEIQKEIRLEINNKKKVVLMAKDFTGTVLSVAQTNLLPYFRKNILGLVLEESPVNLFDMCIKEKKDVNNTVCQDLDSFRKELGSLASKVEVAIALSPALQMDWYWSKTLIVGAKYKKEWANALDENSIEYFMKEALEEESILDYFPLKESQKVQPKNIQLEPQYHGPLLRFHLNKIAYKSKNKIIKQKEISYGIDFYQGYDVYSKEKSKNNPLMIYVHGGGWTKGDKKSYENLCKQYADRGFTAVSINYRLLEKERIGIPEMVDDVKIAIEHILNNAKHYNANNSKVLVMGESAGGQLAVVAISKLTAKHKISVSVFNSMSTDLRIFSKKKQIRLSGIEDNKKRLEWLDSYSPINQLSKYEVPTLVSHSFNDQTVPSQHLEDFEVFSGIYANNIIPFWVEGGMHPIVPQHRSLQPSYIDIENKNIEFINYILVNP